MITSTRPDQGTRAGGVHDLVWRLRKAALDGDRPGRALALVRHLDADTARAALIVAIVSESWPHEDQEAMRKPESDTREQANAILRENRRLREEFEAAG